jgi:hypothetical protein
MTYSVTVIIDNGGIAGHSYVILSGNGAYSEYGFNPAGGSGFSRYDGAGTVKTDESTSRADANPNIQRSVQELPLTDQQYQAARNYAESVKNTSSHYNGAGKNGGMNCVDFVDNLLSYAGQESVGNIFSDDELSFSKAGIYADLQYGDKSLLGIIDDLLDGIEEGFDMAQSAMNGAISAMANALGLADATPICLDLTNNNLQYIPNTANSGVYFDIDADGFAEKTEWLAPDDGFLVRDLNNNGVIYSQAEMFRDNGGTTAYAKLVATNNSCCDLISFLTITA